ncbi:hypothetical protein KR044_002275, partial [Drosophila immigrans]
MSNPSIPPRRLAPGSATPVVTAGVTKPVTTSAAAQAPAATAALTARLSGGSSGSCNTVTSSAITLEQAAAETMASPMLQPVAATSCPDSPIRRVSSSLKNSALDFASRFFNKCKAATFTVDGATYTI